MTDDKNKSYQDGLYNQPYNGRNWDQWVSGNNARQNSTQNNYYTGPTPAKKIEWPAVAAPDKRSKKEQEGDGRGILALALLPAIVVCIGIIAVAAVLGVVAAPILKTTEKIMGGGARKRFFSAYLTAVKALSAFGITFCGLGFIVHLLKEYVFSNSLITHMALDANVLFYFFLHHQPVPAGAVIGTLIYFGLPSLAAFAYILKRDDPATYSGGRGFLRGMATGLPALGVSLLLAGLFYTLTVS